MAFESSVLSYLRSTYPVPGNKVIANVLEMNDISINTGNDFARLLSSIVSDGEENMDVRMSSTWAVCQEFLGNLSGYDLEYAQRHGGCWVITHFKEEKKCEAVSIRSILKDLFERFP